MAKRPRQPKQLVVVYNSQGQLLHGELIEPKRRRKHKRPVKLTDRGVRALKPRPGKQYDRFDKLVPGLCVRVSYDGSKSWGLKYVNDEGRQRRHKLGPYGTVEGLMGVAAARAEALRLKAKIAEGDDPAKERKDRRELVRKGLRFGEMVNVYIDQHAKQKKRSWREDERILQGPLYFPRWHDRLAGGITDVDVDRHIREIAKNHGRIMANRALAALRKAFGFAIKHLPFKDRAGRPERNPCRDVEKPADELSRDRTYTNEEIKRLWPAFKQIDRAGLVFQLGLVTGQRLKEIAGMRWSEIEDTLWTVPAERSKNKRLHIVPLSGLALEIIEPMRSLGSEYVFPSPVTNTKPIGAFGKPAGRVRVLSGIKDFRSHDLRRSCMTGITRLGFPRFIADQVLGHVIRGVGGVYDRHDYLREKAEALAAWERRLRSVLGIGGNVVPMKRPG